MIARPLRIDAGRAGKRSAVAAAWRRLETLRARGFAPDGAGGWIYCSADDWIRASSNFDYAWGADGPVPAEVAARLTRYVADGVGGAR